MPDSSLSFVFPLALNIELALIFELSATELILDSDLSDLEKNQATLAHLDAVRSN